MAKLINRRGGYVLCCGGCDSEFVLDIVENKIALIEEREQEKPKEKPEPSKPKRERRMFDIMDEIDGDENE